MLNGVMAESEGIFRLVRRRLPKEKNDFAISKSDAFVGQLIQQIQIITLSAQIIAGITLLGAAVALLNVMLVSVTERTREIGLRKSLGASRNNILSQFLWEAVMICQIGGILGILLGILGGNIVSTFLFKGRICHSLGLDCAWIYGLSFCRSSFRFVPSKESSQGRSHRGTKACLMC